MTHAEWVRSIIESRSFDIMYWELYILSNLNDIRYYNYFLETLFYNTDVLWSISLAK